MSVCTNGGKYTAVWSGFFRGMSLGGMAADEIYSQTFAFARAFARESGSSCIGRGDQVGDGISSCDGEGIAREVVGRSFFESGCVGSGVDIVDCSVVENGKCSAVRDCCEHGFGSCAPRFACDETTCVNVGKNSCKRQGSCDLARFDSRTNGLGWWRRCSCAEKDVSDALSSDGKHSFEVSGNSCHEEDVARSVCHEKGDQEVGAEIVGSDKKIDVPGAFGSSRCEKAALSVAGANVERNREWRKMKKEKKQKKKSRKPFEEKKSWRRDDGVKDASPFSLNSLVRDQNVELRNSLAAKWKAENALAQLRAERQLAVLSASDLQDEVKQHRTKLNATIERNMVSIEKTHATLRATGNVAGEFHGSAETILTPDLSSGSISPDSSASMHEFRAVQKKNLDLESEVESLKKKLALVTEKTGFSGPYIDLYDQDFWTNNSVNNAILDEMYPHGYGMDGSYCNDGKVRVIPM